MANLTLNATIPITLPVAVKPQSFDYAPIGELPTVEGALLLENGDRLAFDNELDAATVLLLHMDGADLSTSFPDSSLALHDFTAVADAKVRTDLSKFGGAALALDGTGDYVTAPDHADFHLFAADATIDLWVRFAALPGTGLQQQILCQRLDGNNGQFFRLLNTGGVLSLSYFVNAASTTRGNFTATWTPSINTWYHIAIERHGSNCNFYVDGVKLTTTVTTAWGTVQDIASDVAIGAVNVSGNSPLNGRIDEFRISKGVARYAGAASFTPRSAAYSSLVGVLLLEG